MCNARDDEHPCESRRIVITANDAGLRAADCLPASLSTSHAEGAVSLLKLIFLLVSCPVINLHKSCLDKRHLFLLRRDVDANRTTQGGAGIER